MQLERETIDLGARGHHTIGQLSALLRQRGALQRQLRQRLVNGDWFVDEFPGVLTKVAALRNPGVHQARVGREAVLELRNALVGVGCQGALVELARVRSAR